MRQLGNSRHQITTNLKQEGWRKNVVFLIPWHLYHPNKKQTNTGTTVHSGIFCLFVCFHFRKTPAAHGSSQARGQIGAAAAGLQHSHCNARSKPHLWHTLQLASCQILNPLREARDQTHILMDTTWVLNLHTVFLYNSKLSSGRDIITPGRGKKIPKTVKGGLKMSWCLPPSSCQCLSLAESIWKPDDRRFWETKPVDSPPSEQPWFRQIRGEARYVWGKLSQ